MLGEDLGVAQCQRGERRERLQELDVAGRERTVIAAEGDADHAAGLAAPDHRRDERAREPAVRLVRHGRVALGRHGARLLERRAGEPPFRRELEAEEAAVEPAHGRAAQDAPLGIEQVAVGGIRPEQLRDLVDQAL